MLPGYEKGSYGREALPNLIDEKVGVGTNENASKEVEALLGDGVAALEPNPIPKPEAGIETRPQNIPGKVSSRPREGNRRLRSKFRRSR